ncbi:cytidine deaminase [Lepeophtheirus salmonis]|uniref:Cytidine deaminase n=1 Tax=Lepeophtheirus salmonis TaxID=72036 RepID=A0A0K2USA8_LEPSM|nr:cytidine deaminase-like [Lepeophtheirus salmonis]XP_040566793.1 cytidine deaminase-like [Lepeophtheirus salmonis]XP_040566800.1 cytidine deaminase-like [Lepeophtheirus salmonis]XP_040566806.1 cytidine deaminase-like [Lepeophtheirus salmonis]
MSSEEVIVELSVLSQKDKELCLKSMEMRSEAYCPYSKFSVGAALRCADESIVAGCNVENASYGLSICAERTAIVSAVASGKKEFTSIAISADLQNDEFASPCGACRQFMAEFDPKLPIFLVRHDSKVLITNLERLLPNAFSPQNTDLPF